jgi:hypothetical protein
MVLGIALAVVLACDDEPTPPPPPAVTLDSAWPNADSLQWNYDLTSRAFWNVLPDSLYATAEEVPPLPPLQDLATRLATPNPDPPDSVVTARYRLRFNGTGMTASGATGQHLVGEVFAAAHAVTSASSGAGFLHRLATARPDLQSRIAATHPDGRREHAGDQLPRPLFLHGGMLYEKTATHIGAYAYLGGPELAWKWLEADVTPGHEFVLQLAPTMADDIFLHGRVLGSRTVSVPSGTYDRIVDVVYAVDWGVVQVRDEANDPLGYLRVYDYGSIAYAADVGPVESVERTITLQGISPDPRLPALRELRVAHRPPPTSARQPSAPTP